MKTAERSTHLIRPSLSFILLVLLLATLWVAGGASRADVPGQSVVRAVAYIVLIVALLFAERPRFRGSRPVLFAILAVALLAFVQLFPLPPAIWTALPGRALLLEASAASGQDQPWRPLSLVPSATLNAASALIVPFVVLVLSAGLKDRERSWLPGLLLLLILASALLGLLQFAGAVLNNPLINDVPGEVSASFANRNHLALFLAFGCLVAPVWAFLNGRRPRWRGPVAVGAVVFLALLVVAIGSRAGLVVGLFAVFLGIMITRRNIQRELRGAPRWALPAVIASAVGGFAILILFSIAAGRAESLTRVFHEEIGSDLRGRALPTVLAMIREYFPFGTGMGTFDPVYRMHEPTELLNLKYLNHAHNDWVELVLEGGLLGIVIWGAAFVWWAVMSFRAWRAGAGSGWALPKLGSAILLLIAIASAFDYPARTPMIMAIAVVAGLWLAEHSSRRQQSTLPPKEELL